MEQQDVLDEIDSELLIHERMLREPSNARDEFSVSR